MRILKHVSALGLTGNQVDLMCKCFGYRVYEEPVIDSTPSRKPLEETTKLALSAVAQEDGVRKESVMASAFSFKSPKRLVITSS